MSVTETYGFFGDLERPVGIRRRLSCRRPVVRYPFSCEWVGELPFGCHVPAQVADQHPAAGGRVGRASARRIRKNLVVLVRRVDSATLAPEGGRWFGVNPRPRRRTRQACGPSRGSADPPDMPPNGGCAVGACGNPCDDTGVRWISPGRACAPPYR